MDYKKKIEYDKKIATQLEGKKSVDAIKSELKTEGFYDRDITSIMVSARNILGEKFQPKINEYLLGNKQIHGAEEFNLLDKELLDTLVEQETKSIASKEKKKITQLMKAGHAPEEVLAQVDTRFLPANKAGEHITNLQQIRNQSSGSGRMLNLGGGLGLIALTAGIFATTGRLFYVLPFIGLFMIVKGFLPEKIS